MFYWRYTTLQRWKIRNRWSTSKTRWQNRKIFTFIIALHCFMHLAIFILDWVTLIETVFPPSWMDGGMDVHFGSCALTLSKDCLPSTIVSNNGFSNILDSNYLPFTPSSTNYLVINCWLQNTRIQFVSIKDNPHNTSVWWQMDQMTPNNVKFLVTNEKSSMFSSTIASLDRLSTYVHFIHLFSKPIYY